MMKTAMNDRGDDNRLDRTEVCLLPMNSWYFRRWSRQKGSWEFLVSRESSERAKAHGKAQSKRRQGSRLNRFRFPKECHVV